ncbi:aspartate/glutamate racemase family protein [Mycobacterium shigaense]|uniref:aspartate/glutamate racemase family protein n=1 Tax=Mycobacterium shigaense TaxID=722731 RepID=UPI0022B2547B|nr:aspartate/glutamate racemase family protein [Mycobacterium shigaense]MEA1125041.1 aspartate/glutamate racemase family protein [Mycobacterium shigaense]
MRRIWVINPNSTREMTQRIEACARAVVGPNTEITGVTSQSGPPSIQSHRDSAMSVAGVLAAVAEGERNGVDGYVLACFGDPGLAGAREIARGPVIGIAEAAMHTASHLGRGFSVVTSLARTIGQSVDLAEDYGMQRFCRGIHACEIPVLDLDGAANARTKVTEACRDALRTDDSDVIVLGCAGMADMSTLIAAELGVPVVDGVTAATLTVQSLITLGLGTSKRGEFAYPTV